jgi:hypothetical protein
MFILIYAPQKYKKIRFKQEKLKNCYTVSETSINFVTFYERCLNIYGNEILCRLVLFVF